MRAPNGFGPVKQQREISAKKAPRTGKYKEKVSGKPNPSVFVVQRSVAESPSLCMLMWIAITDLFKNSEALETLSSGYSSGLR